MIRAVVDPSVLVSAFIGRPGSAPDQVVRAWRSGRCELIVSPALLAELAAVLARPKFAQAAGGGRAQDYVNGFTAGATVATDEPAGEPLTRDAKDDYLVRLARAVRADALVSVDRDLLEAEVPDVAILSPREFVERLESA